MNFFHGACEIASHAAGKGVPCPGGVVNVFKRVGAAAEKLIAFAKKQRAVLSFLYRDVPRTHFSNATPGLDETCLLGDLPCFAVIEDEEINATKQRIQVCSRCLDPKIHRVSDNKTWARHLVEHMSLQRGCDVGQQNEIGLTIRVWQHRFEIFKYIQRDGARLARIQVPGVFAGPAESFSIRPLHTFAVDLAQFPKLKFRFGKIAAYNSDQSNR